GRVGAIVLSIAAIFAFSSVANAGILSASRYPLAMSRDHLLPAGFAKVSDRGVPVISILFTVAVIIGLVFLDPMKIAKLASAFQLLMFALLCLAVIVMRESRIAAYDPGYRSPLYPWIQLVGIGVSAVFIYYMGLLPILFTVGVVIIGAVWYRRFGATRVVRQGAIYHVFERLGRQRFDGLDSELRGILKEKGLRAGDPFEEIVALSHVFEAHDGETFDSVANRAAGIFSANLSLEREALTRQFLEGTRIGATPVTSGVALPHLRLPNIQLPRLVIVRSMQGVEIAVSEIGADEMESRRVAAMFFLVSDRDRPTQHLRVLAELAGRVEQPNFMDRWLAAQDEQRLRELLLREDQYLVVRLDGREGWVDRPVRTLNLPEDLLIVTVIRADDLVPPKGSTVLARGDRITMIGSEASIAVVRRHFGVT
ncbi:MAG: amino acid permease, partial [Nannocystaceae bacterium]